MMEVCLVLFILIAPTLMMASAWVLPSWKIAYAVIAVLCAYVFSMVFALAVYKVLRDETVFMTNIHEIFQNKLVLVSSGYLGVYGLYRLQVFALKQYKEE